MILEPGTKLPPSRRLTFGTTGQRLNLRRSDLSMERSSYLEEWVDIADFFRVRRSRAMQSGAGMARKRNRTKRVLNEHGQFASRTLGAGMLAGVSSPSRPWLKLGTPDRELNEYKSVKLWLDQAQRAVYRVFAASNYYHVKQTSFQDMGDFGQGPVLIDEDFENVINCYCSPAGEYYLSIDARGVVDTLYRDLSRTTMQLVEKFGGNVPREVRDSWDAGSYDKMWDIVHAVQPNLRYIRGAKGPLGMPWSSIYWMPGASDADDNSIMEVKGYHENPISAPRWDVQANDVYGDGPGSLALPGNKSLQSLEKRKGQLIDKLAVPPLQAPSDMKNSVISHAPGQPSYYNSMQGTQAPIQPLYVIHPQALEYVSNEGDKIENRIDRAYFVDLFLRITNSTRRQVTATEIEEGHEEKLIALGPVLERTHYEGLNPEIKRTFGIVARAGMIPPPPPEMDGQALKIEYTSLLAVAQRAIGVTTLERFTGYIGSLSANNPAVMDKFDDDQAVDEYADFAGLPASVVRSDEEVAKIRDGRAREAKRQEQMAQVQQAADIAKTAAGAPTRDGSNLLADLIGNGGRIV